MRLHHEAQRIGTGGAALFAGCAAREGARDLLPKLGYWGNPYDDFSRFNWYDEFYNWAGANDKPRNWRNILSQEPAMLRFTYRTSPGPMTAAEFHSDLLTPGIVSGDDPPVTAAGMTYLEIDQHGHLMYFEARPPQLLEPAKDAPPADWSALFSAAGLDPSKLQPAEPLWTWLSTSDARTAWTGTWPISGRPMRVEAAALRGKPVGFYVLGPWSAPWRKASRKEALRQPGFPAATRFAGRDPDGAPLLARMNLLRGRGDRKGALRVGSSPAPRGSSSR